MEVKDTHAMHITSNTPRPKAPKRQGPNLASWIFFLVLALGPLRGIVRALLPPQISDSQLLLLVIGVFALAVTVSLVARGLSSRSSGPQMPTMPGASGSWSPTNTAPRQRLEPARLPSRPAAGYPGPPRFEPIITGKVIFAGFVVAALLIVLFFVLVILLGIR